MPVELMRIISATAGGNLETGPFYIEDAMPGDVLVVHINKLRLNRDWAGSDDSLADRSLNSDLAVKMKDVGKEVDGILTAQTQPQFLIPPNPFIRCWPGNPELTSPIRTARFQVRDTTPRVSFLSFGIRPKTAISDPRLGSFPRTDRLPAALKFFEPQTTERM
jgi:hypothetical protein